MFLNMPLPLLVVLALPLAALAWESARIYRREERRR
jgi:hypothetical protein